MNDQCVREGAGACRAGRVGGQCAQRHTRRAGGRYESRDRQLWTHAAIAPWDGQRLTGRAMLVRRFRSNADELLIIGPSPLVVGDTFALRGADLPWSKTPTCCTVAESRQLPGRQNFARLRLS